MAKRQTIWLSTMMVLSLMLIGFYTVNNNVQQVSSTDAAQMQKQKTTADKKADKAVMEQSDYFIQRHLQENQTAAKQAESLEAVIADANAPADKVEQAKKDLNNLNAQEDKIDNVIEQITAEGYADALVDLQNGKVNVTVQAQTLDTKKAIKIMNIVSKELQVSAAKITVLAHQ